MLAHYAPKVCSSNPRQDWYPRCRRNSSYGKRKSTLTCNATDACTPQILSSAVIHADSHIGLVVTAAVLVFCLYASAEGADSERGRLLYENHCLACHETLAYMREAHKVRSLSDLRVQVIRWAQNQKLEWGKDEVNDVVNYLDNQYYHYGPTSD